MNHNAHLILNPKKELSLKEVLNDLFRIGVENIRRIKQEEVQNECDDKVFGDIDQEDENVDVNTAREKEEVHVKELQPYVPPIPFPNELKIVRQEELGKKVLKNMEVRSLRIEEAKPHDNVESIAKQNGSISNPSFMPSTNDIASVPIQVSEVIDAVMQSLTSQAIHITPPDHAYVAPATNLILVDISKEFNDELLSISLTDEEAKCPMMDVEELEQLLVHVPFSSPKDFREHSKTMETNPLIHPQHGVRQSSKSSAKPGQILGELSSLVLEERCDPWLLQLEKTRGV
ncbi:hypothetical protein Tco_0159094 [Tanacetum coccineum]